VLRFPRLRRFRLRYRGSDLDLALGEFVVGRSAECNLALDDPLVSRRHATFRVGADGVSVEDLGSRNGVTINGERVSGRHDLRHLDRVKLGSEEMIIVEVGGAREARVTGLMSVCQGCRIPIDPAETRCSHCGTAVVPQPLAGQTLEIKNWPTQSSEGPLARGDDEDTRRASSFMLLAGIADKALALGRVDEAERVLSGLLADLLTKTQAGKSPPDDSIRDAVRYALRLAELSAKGSWLDWVFQIHEATGKLLPAPTIDALYTLVRKIRYSGSAAFRSYVRAMKERAKTFSPSERFVLQRLEGLERVVAA